jgi:soluble lytic murein transglycosylase
MQKRTRRTALPWCIAGGVLLFFAILYSCRTEVRDWIVDDTLYSTEIRRYAEKYELDPQLVRALIFQESRFNPECRGSKGEVGLMQLLPEGAVADYTAIHKIRGYSRRALRHPELNLEIGCWYLSRAVRRWKGHPDQLALALSQYNAGERRVAKWAENKLKPEEYPIKSTRIYVRKILTRYHQYLKEQQ